MKFNWRIPWAYCVELLAAGLVYAVLELYVGVDRIVAASGEYWPAILAIALGAMAAIAAFVVAALIEVGRAIGNQSEKKGDWGGVYMRAALASLAIAAIAPLAIFVAGVAPQIWTSRAAGVLLLLALINVYTSAKNMADIYKLSSINEES